MAITNIGYDGSINEPSWAKLVEYLGKKYAVGSSADFAVTTVSGVDRTVRVAPGNIYGRGVLTTSDADVDVQSAILASGTRWDTIVVRRNWSTNTTTVVAVSGTATEQLAAGLNATPGVIDDQPIALVQITSGQQVPTAVRDLRPNVVDPKRNVGDVFMHAGPTPPFGAVAAQNQSLSRAQYSRLFAVIGTTHGAGDGSTTFLAPNAKGKVLVGLDPSDTDFDTVGETRGAKTHALSTAELASHAHGLNGHQHGGTTGTTGMSHSHVMSHGHGRSYGATYGGAGNHAHGLPQSDFGGLGGGGTLVRLGYNGGFPSGSAGAGAHDHSAYVDVNDFSGSTGLSDPSHSHAVNADNGNTANAGTGTAHNNVQPSVVMLACVQV